MTRRRWRPAAVAAALAAAAGAAQAHPHGAVACSAEVRLEAARLQGLRGELRFDEAHSQQALALVRTPDGVLDPDLLRRFAFGLKLQMGRLNWLFALQADGVEQALRPGEPVLDVVDGRLRVRVDFAPVEAAPHRDWSLRCADPSYYWVANFQVASGMLPAADSGASAARDDPAALRIEGCGQAGARAAGDPPGSGRIDWRCLAAP